MNRNNALPDRRSAFLRTCVILLPVLLLLVACGTPSDQVPQSKRDHCPEVRAAFDIGSGNTKLIVANVDTCSNTVNEVLFEGERAVAYMEVLERSGKNGKKTLSDDILKEGHQALAELKQKANGFDPDAYSGVATSVFRKAANGDRAVNRLSQATGIPIRRISEEVEARLGVIGASRFADASADVVAVWDIGAGSMQLTVRRRDGDPMLYHGSLASIPFKRSVIELQGRDPDRVDSPNPLGVALARRALERARRYAKQDVPPSIQSLLKEMNGPVIGIGGVHEHSIRPQVAGGDAKRYSKSAVVDTLMKRARMNDDEIGGEYASTEVTNLALVGGMMDGLGIDHVRVADVNLTDGLLLANDFWERAETSE